MKKIIIILIIAIAIGAGTFVVIKNMNEVTEPAFYRMDEPSIIVKTNNDIKEYMGREHIRMDNDHIYVSREILENDLGININYNLDHDIAVMTTLDDVIRFYGEQGKVKLNQDITKDISEMLVTEDTVMFPIDALKDYINIEYREVDNVDRVIMWDIFSNKKMAKVNGKAKIKEGRSFWTDNLGIISDENNVEIISEEGPWAKVITEGGIIGYVKEDKLKDINEIEGVKRQEKTPIWKPESGKIILTWEQVHSRNPNTDKINHMEGVNVISPTWLSLKDSSGDISEKISTDYMKWAKGRDYKVWVLFSNSFNPDLTDKFLNNPIAREKAINDLVSTLTNIGADGINIDFENVYLKNKEILVQFVRELTPIMHKNGLVVSMDVTIKGGSDNWSKFYDRKAIGEIVDYVALMTYDEHWAASPISGSVASIGWVENGVKGLLEDVPEEKLLLGVPLYTRLWTETPSTEEPNKMVVKSRAFGMERVKEIMEKENIVKLWDDDAGQYYVVYIEDGAVHKIWVEDGKSIELKSQLINKYNLAGIATWSRGFETTDIWHVIDRIIN